jgi:hypothetical protein
MLDMETEEKKRRWKFTKEHYKELAAWAERVALLLLGSLVLQNVVSAFSLAEPVVIGGVIFTVIAYYGALTFLSKS